MSNKLELDMAVLQKSVDDYAQDQVKKIFDVAIDMEKLKVQVETVFKGQFFGKNATISEDITRRLGWVIENTVEQALKDAGAQDMVTSIVSELLEDPAFIEDIKTNVKMSILKKA